MDRSKPETLETDPRFPSGPWTGFFLQPLVPGRHMMEMGLTFGQGRMAGEGRDWVGQFVLRGTYDLQDGTCHWTKRYVGKHDVFYKGYNEGKGIWGTWTMASEWRGGFHIWPEGMADPTATVLHEEVDLPAVVEESLETTEPISVPL